MNLFRKYFNFKLIKFILIFPLLVALRLISPFILFRFGPLISSRIGHFAANTELYLCEMKEGVNVPNQKYFDIFFFDDKIICNSQLSKMWKRVLHIGPFWWSSSIASYIGYLPGGSKHLIPKNIQHDRDVLNLLDKHSSHLWFTDEEEKFGQNALNSLGVPSGMPFVCIIVRDKEYLSKKIPGSDWDYHNYRDCSIENFALAAVELVSRGYYVIRMGALVEKPFPIENPKIIDYAFNSMRSDFMDIYLGAKCFFCISTGTGWDAVPAWLFRKPTVFTNLVPFGYLPTFRKDFIYITKHHIDLFTNIELSLTQIFERGAGYCMRSKDYADIGILLLENTEEEIRDVVLEMEERLVGKIIEDDQYFDLQDKFNKSFPSSYCDERGIPLHGEILGSFGHKYLKTNQDWII